MVVNSDCIFCKIANKEIKSKIIAENDYAIAFLDVDPVANGHVLVIPKKHFEDLSTCDNKYLMGTSLLVKEISKKLMLSPLEPKGINYISNEKTIAGQQVMHFHMHVIPKYEMDKGFKATPKKEDICSLVETFDKIKKSKYIIT